MLDGWALSFNYLGVPYAEPGFATIHPIPATQAATQEGAQASTATSASASTASTAIATAAPAGPTDVPPSVHGVLHLISEEDWGRVMQSEGVASDKSGWVWGGGWQCRGGAGGCVWLCVSCVCVKLCV